MRRGLILFFFLSTSSAFSQIESQIIREGKIETQKSFRDSLALSNYVNEQVSQYVKEGFFFASLDSISWKSNRVDVYLHGGKRYNSKIYFDSEIKRNPTKSLKKILTEYTSNGYPFAQVKLDSVSLLEGVFTGELNVKEGPGVTYDSSFFLKKIKTNKKYVYQLLDIVPETPFNEVSYRFLEKKVERVSFLKLLRPVDVSFRNNKAITFLDLEESETNTFQGILGLQQGQDNGSEVVGSLDLSIDNLFNSGKELDFFWERYGQNSQRLNLKYHHPFFLDSKISPNISFNLLKQDSIFVTRETGIGFSTFVSSNISLSIEYKRKVGTLLSRDEQVVISQSIADFEKNEYRIGLQQGFLEKLGGFEEGFYWNVNLSGGRKTIQENLNISEIFYDTIQLETDFFQSEIDVAYQLKVWKRQTLFHHFSGKMIRNSELLTNELYRIGGFSSIRGFNEKLFFADQYISSRVEFRSFFENRSYLYVLYDQLIYKRNDSLESPFGIGIGFALTTSSGQFNFALAAGRSEKQGVDFSNVLAHFGYTSRF
ncbi:MAG: hypothetical protein AB8B73_09780 [Ekhidna sp.]